MTRYLVFLRNSYNICVYSDVLADDLNIQKKKKEVFYFNVQKLEQHKTHDTFISCISRRLFPNMVRYSVGRKQSLAFLVLWPCLSRRCSGYVVVVAYRDLQMQLQLECQAFGDYVTTFSYCLFLQLQDSVLVFLR